MLNATFDNISVLLVEETRENKTTDLSKSLTNSIKKCCIEYTSPERQGQLYLANLQLKPPSMIIEISKQYL
jgi:hypothetical protein